MIDNGFVPRLVVRNRVMGMWLTLIGAWVVLGASLLWDPPPATVLSAAGLLLMIFGSWWTLSPTPGIVLWWPWEGVPTVYYDRDHVLGKRYEMSVDLDRVYVRAILWAEAGWRQSVPPWLTSLQARWILMARVGAVRVRRRFLTERIPLGRATKEETEWLHGTITSMLLERSLYNCGIGIGRELRDLGER